MPIDGKPVKGRGAADQVPNRFLKRHYGVAHWEGIDEVDDDVHPTKYVIENPKTIINRVDSPDLGFNWSLNPYQGCEHGCAYCYARPTHEYWGYSAGLDFERVIIVKRNAPELLEKALRHPKWSGESITISGATDPYQPIEREERITRRVLEKLFEFHNACGIITKNALVLRDLDLLREMAAEKLVSVAISLTTLDEELRRKMEPRTSTGLNRLKTIETLSNAGVPVWTMIAPIIPGLNDKEVPALLKAAAEAGAVGAGYTVLRTNGAVENVFRSWLQHHYPERAAKVIAQTKALHMGSMSDQKSGRRMKGDGAFAENIRRVFSVFRKRYFKDHGFPRMDTAKFKRPPQGQLELFGQ